MSVWNVDVNLIRKHFHPKHNRNNHNKTELIEMYWKDLDLPVLCRRVHGDIKESGCRLGSLNSTNMYCIQLYPSFFKPCDVVATRTIMCLFVASTHGSFSSENFQWFFYISGTVCVYALAIFVIIPDNGVYMCVWYIWYMHIAYTSFSTCRMKVKLQKLLLKQNSLQEVT